MDSLYTYNKQRHQQLKRDSSIRHEMMELRNECPQLIIDIMMSNSDLNLKQFKKFKKGSFFNKLDIIKENLNEIDEHQDQLDIVLSCDKLRWYINNNK